MNVNNNNYCPIAGVALFAAVVWFFMPERAAEPVREDIPNWWKLKGDVPSFGAKTTPPADNDIADAMLQGRLRW